MKIKGSESDSIRFKDLKEGDVFSTKRGYGMKCDRFAEHAYNVVWLDNGQLGKSEDEAWVRHFPQATLVPSGVKDDD